MHDIFAESKMSTDDLVLSYHDCLLRQSDVQLLHGPYWLNDALIGFYFEYLGQKYEDLKSKFLFISPELTQLLKLTEITEYPVFLGPIEAKKTEFVFFPINDCNSRSSAGGMHWSLVVYSKPERTCFHFDSSKGFNLSVARDFSRSIMNYLIDGNGDFVEVECPQQQNGYDCGLFVLCFVDIITTTVVKNLAKYLKIVDINYENVRSIVSKKRMSLIALIDALRHSGN